MRCQGLLGKLESKGSVIYWTDIHGAVDRGIAEVRELPVGLMRTDTASWEQRLGSTGLSSH